MIYSSTFFKSKKIKDDFAKVIMIGDVSVYTIYDIVAGIDPGDGKGIRVLNQIAGGPEMNKALDAIDGGSDKAKAKRLNIIELNKLADEIEVKRMKKMDFSS